MTSGFSTPVSRVTLDDVPVITKAVFLHETVLSVKSEIDQLAEGLDLFGIRQLIKAHPSLMKPLFVYDSQNVKLTVDKMSSLFQVVYSPHGTSNRILEEATFLHWHDFLNDLANGLIGKPCASVCTFTFTCVHVLLCMYMYIYVAVSVMFDKSVCLYLLQLLRFIH